MTFKVHRFCDFKQKILTTISLNLPNKYIHMFFILKTNKLLNGKATIPVVMCFELANKCFAHITGGYPPNFH